MTSKNSQPTKLYIGPTASAEERAAAKLRLARQIEEAIRQIPGVQPRKCLDDFTSADFWFIIQLATTGGESIVLKGDSLATTAGIKALRRIGREIRGVIKNASLESEKWGHLQAKLEQWQPPRLLYSSHCVRIDRRPTGYDKDTIGLKLTIYG